MLSRTPSTWPRLRAAAALAYHLPGVGLTLHLDETAIVVGGIRDGADALHPADLRELVAHALTAESTLPLTDGLGAAPQSGVSINWTDTSTLLPTVDSIILRSPRPDGEGEHWVFTTDVWWERSLPMVLEHEGSGAEDEQFVESLLEALRSLEVWSLYDDALALTVVSVTLPTARREHLQPVVLELARRLLAHSIDSGDVLDSNTP